MYRKSTILFLVVILALVLAVPAAAKGGRADPTGVIYVTGQGLHYDTFVTAGELPMEGPFRSWKTARPSSASATPASWAAAGGWM